MKELKTVAFHFDDESDEESDNTSKQIVDIKTKKLLTQCLQQCIHDIGYKYKSYYNNEAQKYWNTVVPKQFMMIKYTGESHFMIHMADISVKLVYKPFHDVVRDLLINDEGGDTRFEYNEDIIDALWKQNSNKN